MARGRKKLPISRSEIITIRLDPKLRFAAELAARQFRRTLSRFIEMSVKEMLTQLRYNKAHCYTHDLHSALKMDEEGKEMLDKQISLLELAERLWDADEADRLVNLAQEAPYLLTTEEQRVWKVIEKTKKYWRYYEEEGFYAQEDEPDKELRIELVRQEWDEIVEKADKLPLMTYYEDSMFLT